jgi:hypothetical protein
MIATRMLMSWLPLMPLTSLFAFMPPILYPFPAGRNNVLKQHKTKGAAPRGSPRKTSHHVHVRAGLGYRRTHPLLRLPGPAACPLRRRASPRLPLPAQALVPPFVSGNRILGVPHSKTSCKRLVMSCTYALGRSLGSSQDGPRYAPPSSSARLTSATPPAFPGPYEMM